ncbi:lumenal Hsp70 protein [Malassezia psittaci]|uniref:Lumenal Hsp70 protein n=1 Tax=Malassezia psittaci TaxID=1821823 RepID=A0AAF0JER6_9BASI|nr:lumenal Hsp70 protein [Malassezia psittaci]
MRSLSVSWLAALTAAVFVVVFAPYTTAIGVVSIDYGTEWIKTALVKPGMPFDVVLSRDSKRKVQSTVAFKGKVPSDGNLARQERLLGGDAFAYASRDPLQTYHAAKLLLGRSCNKTEPNAARLYKTVFGNDLVQLVAANASGSSCLVRPSPEITAYWRPEEIVGMQLDHIRELAEDTAGEQLSIGFLPGSQAYFSAQKGLDTVITVPIFFDANERRALHDSAVLAGFRPHLISDSAAAAVNYAQSRSFPKPEYHIFYDVGSGSSRAALVELSEAPSTDSRQRAVTNVRVLDAAWARDVGGLTLDLLLRDLLADAFDHQHASSMESSIHKDKRAMARLLREANRVKHVLSTNAEASSYVESLANDLDLKTSITRDQFDTAMKSSKQLDRIIAPIQELLQQTKRTMQTIDSIVMIGGSTRVPAVQTALRSSGVPEEKIAVNVNADEAPVMGAALFAANMQPALRMKQVNVTDANMYAVDLSDVSTRQVNTVFPAGPIEQQSIDYEVDGADEDFGITLAYTPDAVRRLSNEVQGPLLHATFEGITETLQELRLNNDLSNVNVRVNASVGSDPLGIYGVYSPTLIVTPKASITGTLRNFFKSEESSDSNETDTTSGELTKERVEPLTLTTEWLTPVRPLVAHDKLTALERLRMIVYEAKQRVKKDTASNQLESLLYQSRELLDDPEFTPFISDSERNSIKKEMDNTNSFLSDNVDDATASDVEKKFKDFSKLLRAPKERVDESTRRPESTRVLRETIEEGKQFLVEARANLTAALQSRSSSKFSVVELDALQTQLDQDAKWLDDGERAQSTRKTNENAVLRSEDMEKRARKIRDTINRLRRRRIPKTRPPKKASESASSSETSSAKATQNSESSSTPVPTSDSSTSSTYEPPVHSDL